MPIENSQYGGLKKVNKMSKKKLTKAPNMSRQSIKEDKENNMELISNSNNLIDIDSVYRFIDLYFKQKNVMYTHLYNSFDKLLDEDIPNFLKNNKSVFFEKVTKDKVYKYLFKFDDIAIKPPFIDMDDEIMFPQHARLRNMTYSSKLVATITQIQEITDIATDTVTTKVIGQPEYEYPITNLPIMVRSKYCSLNLKKGYNKSECEYDPGGYFIVNGSEKVVMSLERMIDNRPLVFIKKDSSSVNYTVQVNSKSHRSDLMQIINIRMKKDDTLSIRVPILNEIPVFILMRALGIESDSDIINYCVYDPNDVDMINIIRMSLENSKPEKSDIKIVTQISALNYLTTKLRVIKKYSETSKEIKQQEKRMHLEELLKNNFLPHVEGNLIDKAFYLGYMINRLLQCYLGRIKPDDRDSYINKRVDLPGQLIFDLFKQYYKKMLNECNKFFKKRNTDDENPIPIVNQIKPNIIEQGLKNALLTGTWGKKKGVAQMLQRLSYLQMLSSLRRINSPTVDASTNKLTSPRHLHPTIVGDLCFVETSEGHKVGLVKNLSLIGNVTVMKNSQIDIIKGMIRNKVISVQDIPIKNIRYYTRVLVNGEIIGLTDKPRKLYDELKQMKYNGTFDQLIGIAHDIRSEIECKEIRINCDTGRIYHPTLRVVNNEILLNKTMVDLISIDEKESTTKITSWNQFMMKFPGVIEYIDTDEKYNAMIAMFPSEVEDMRIKMIESAELLKKLQPNDFKNIINRYDNFTYLKYSHCEIHPSLLIGVVVSNIPFCECNQGPRNIFQYSQARQAMGIYATNWRDRLDISYILYHPQRPIVTTRTMKYIGTEQIPAGENCIVAIACYTGYNQEDSNLMSKTAIDYGLFRSTSLKKYMTTIQKNQSTSQDDVFIKPDRSQVTGMRHGTYDKLNEKGYAPEETFLENGDILIGKVSPIQPVGNSNKVFKDSSEYYKSHVPGVIDKVYTEIFNNEGYEMRKVRVRSERVPMIGDKFCSRHGQKGTNGIQLRASDMMFSEKGVQPDIVINPNAIPSRMTLGQLIECLVGKVAALEGQEIDGTAFSKFDLPSIKARMKSLGYEENGYEYMYNGMTGRKIKNMIFIGPTYYQRLKHIVADKIHARARGPQTILTRQPPEGRSRDGGLRFGEMERDTMISHGLARFLKERLLETADIYSCYVCDKCGLFAQRMMRKDNKAYPTKKDIYFCQACRNYTDISKIRIPYAFKLLLQELLAMNICPRIRVKKNAYD
jgi:DNA-directed RNA polymerase II subunit RPB2